jgi:hypothetical protein
MSHKGPLPFSRNSSREKKEQKQCCRISAFSHGNVKKLPYNYEKKYTAEKNNTEIRLQVGQGW